VKIRRTLLPLAVFLAVMGAHFVWLGLFPERDPAQSRWAELPAGGSSWLQTYLDGGSYWLGYSYGIALAFAAAGLRRYRELRLAASRNLALGGISFSGVLAVAGCYLIGCCGSPMLAVYLSLFGAAFLPWAKPLVAFLTTASLLAAWFFSLRCVRLNR
jgi:hypothetical protein